MKKNLFITIFFITTTFFYSCSKKILKLNPKITFQQIHKLTLQLQVSFLLQFYNDTRILDQKFLHMNWGLGTQEFNSGIDNNNGWYDCSINYTRAGTGFDNYTYFQTIIYDIYPNS